MVWFLGSVALVLGGYALFEWQFASEQGAGRQRAAIGAGIAALLFIAVISMSVPRAPQTDVAEMNTPAPRVSYAFADKWTPPPTPKVTLTAVPRRARALSVAPKPTPRTGAFNDRGPDVVGLDTRAEAQYDRAATIVGSTPSNSTAAAEMVGGSEGPGGRFYDQDRQLQSAILCTAPMPTNHRSACLNLAEAEQFEYAAVAASLTSCNEHDAALNLHVARAFLDEIKRDLNGTAPGDWSPPDVTNEVSGNNKCTDGQ